MIILASQSPRRHELMKLTGLPFTVRVADIDETMDPALPSSRRSRASAAGRHRPSPPARRRTILSSPPTPSWSLTGASWESRARRKKRSACSACSPGRTHEVVTVLSVCKGSQLESEAVVTKVTFRTLCEEELRAYVRTGEPMDKAGSYGIQGYGAMFVSRIEGDYFSVMGLPLCPLCRMLRAFGVPILDVQEAQA